MVWRPKKSIQRRLIDCGFDRCTKTKAGWKVGCSCCKAVVINGVPCHEVNCLNLRKAQESDFKPVKTIDNPTGR